MKDKIKMTRRELLAAALAMTVMSSPFRKSEAAAPKEGIPYRVLGATGEQVSIIGIGGAHLGKPDEKQSIEIVRTAIDNGINFLDNSWSYHDGKSELRMGKALKDGYRQKAFLMTKIDGRDKKTALKQLHESLRRLQTDTIDLLQIHEIIRMSDPDRIFASGGAVEALIEAKKDGKIRYVGFTGHKSPDIFLKMLDVTFGRGFSFDAVQMPLNVMDAHYESFEKKVLPILIKHKIGVLGMKPLGAGLLLKSNAVSAVECLNYAMSLPTSVVITGCESLDILQQALDAARNFHPMNENQMASLLARTSQPATGGKFEEYKTTRNFDSTSLHPERMGPETS